MILSYSLSHFQIISHITQVLSRMAQANLTVKKSKCSWCFVSFDFLGICVGAWKLSIPAALVGQFRDFVRPVNKSQLTSFLGLCNFYSHFIPHSASVATPLYLLLRRTSPDIIPWSDDLNKCFVDVISSVVSHSSLVISIVTDVRCVFTDASSRGIGGVLCVYRSEKWVPCAFYSRKLLDRETKFSATELEDLALLETVEFFKMYLSGFHFRAYTDHQALVGVLDGVPSSAKLTRWKLRLAEFDVELVYVKVSR